MLNIKVNVPEELIRFLSPSEQLSCIMRALNRVGDQMFTLAKRSIAERYNLKVPQREYKISKVGASTTNLTFSLSGDFSKFLLVNKYYGGKQTSRGISFKILKQGTTYNIPRAWIGANKKGQVLPMQRETNKRYPIRVLKAGPSFGKMISTELMERKYQILYDEKMPERLQHEYDRILDKKMK